MLSDRMNEIKQKTGLTNASWAERSGVPISTVSRILSGATENPGSQTVLDLISAAEVPLSAVLPDGLVFPDSPASPPAAELLAEKDRRIAGLERQVAFRSRWMRLLAINNNFHSSFCFFLFLPLNASHFLSLHCSNFNFLLPRFSNLQNYRCSFGAQKAPAVSCRGCFCVTPRCTRSIRVPCPARRPCPRATPWRGRGRGPSRCSRGP